MATESEILLAGEYFLGIEGLAIARSSTSRPSSIKARVDEVKTIVARFDEFPQSLALPVVEYQVEAGYAEWAPSYDGPNPAIEREEPVIQALLAGLPKGDALDAACGTGRHAETLTKLGHKVIGVDTTEAMLAIARDKVRGAEFRRGRLEAIPLEGASVDLVTCALALEHVSDLGAVFREFARVLRPGGRVLMSDLHPVTKMTGGVAAFNRANDATRGVHFVSGVTHQVGEYVHGLLAAGFQITECLEPEADEDLLTRFPSYAAYPEATMQAFLGLPYLIIIGATR